MRLRGKAYNEKSIGSKHKVKDIERIWYTTGTKRKCINCLSSQAKTSIRDVKRIKVDDKLTPTYNDELSYIKDLKNLVPHCLLPHIACVSYDLLYDCCIKPVLFSDGDMTFEFDNSSELTTIIRQLYPDPLNKLNRPIESQWLSELTVSTFCVYLRSISSARVFSFASYFFTNFIRMGDACIDNSDELQDSSIVTPPYHFLMRSLICIMTDIDLMQPRELGGHDICREI